MHEDWRLLSLITIFGASILTRLSVDALWPSWWWYWFGITLIVFLLYMQRINQQFSALFIFILLGLSVASFRTETLLEGAVNQETFAAITGVVKRIEIRPNKPTRITMAVTDVNKDISITGSDVQLYVRTKIPSNLKAGDSISTRAVFDVMNGPIVPGGFDYAQYNILKGIVTQGFTVAAIEKINNSQTEDNLQTSVQNFRTQIAQHVVKYMKPKTAGIAVSLITGQREYLDNETSKDLRDTGLSHLLAISGLHMGLLTAAAFALFELIFAAIPFLALRVPPKKLAAVTAWIFACTYLIISGGSTATMRAFIMVSVAILAVMTDRRVVSLRSVALAAFAVLVIDPTAILSVSFHMSFAATAALVLTFEFVAAHKRQKPKTSRTDVSLFGKITLYVLATAGTTLVAQLAVAPFALYHFQALSIVGLLTNIIAIPIMAFIVMPTAFLSLLLIFVGIEPFSLIIMEQGLEAILSVVELVKTIPNGVYHSIPYNPILLPISGIFIATACMLGGKKGLLCWAISAFLALLLFQQAPADILIDNSGKVIAHRLHPNGHMSIIGGRRNGFRDEAWQRYWGLNSETPIQKIEQQCDTRACLINIGYSNIKAASLSIIRSNTLEVTRLACSEGAIVIASYRHRRYCRGAALFMAEEDIKRYGPVGLWLQKANTPAPSDNSQTRSAIKIRWSKPLPRK